VTSVLVVDGRPSDRQLLATVLGHAGYAVAEAATGEVAIAFARSQRPNLIITHILMPDMDGYELVNKLRSEHVTADIRVIFYTATYLIEEVRQLASACGVSQILVKPCEPEEIICAVSEALSSPQVSRVALTSAEFHREHMRVLAAKLIQKIDELHDVERQAAESLTLLEAIQSSAPVGFGFVDREYRLRRVNDVLAAVAGAPVEQLLGRPTNRSWPRGSPSSTRKFRGRPPRRPACPARGLRTTTRCGSRVRSAGWASSWSISPIGWEPRSSARS
jgi:CheY-like chemotaxis protein